MTHFYRFCQAFDAISSGDFLLMKAYRPSGKEGMLPIEWTKAMEVIPQDPPWPHCKVLRAPLYPAAYEQEYNMFRLKPGTAIPDFYGTGERLLVSERARAVLETCDDFEHEYIETEIQNENRQRINEQAYYLLSVRRYLRIEALGEKLNTSLITFSADAYEEDYLPVLQNQPELMEKVAQLPLWRHRLNESVVYMNERVLTTLRDAGLTGLSEYSSRMGEPGETIAYFG
ncbi:hypothetical protein NP603_19105 [Methylomonas sp. SURF-1]|uniref:Immunity MXAN-0049 protein domain-containing protein n=1 Tax=Methylomonas aurea TaxID=2952224 RepID=A0ABT1UNK3_9GAMM|nr:DUF1629 domain-containing protein [Methylomonas sp. SURF-1]MCQ8183230.1 hypothetical protein [Methylomonas sp. SURF-1]